MRPFVTFWMAMFVSIAVNGQCTQESWIDIVSGLPSGVVGVSSQNSGLHISGLSTIYRANEFHSSETLQLSDTTTASGACGTGRGFLIQKTSLTGASIWHRQFCYDSVGDIEGTCIDDSSNFYMSGYFEGTLLYEGNTLAQSSGVSYFILRLGSDGTLDWFKTGIRSSGIVGLTTIEGGLVFCLAVSDSASYNGLTYYKGSNGGSRDFHLIHSDFQGTPVWNKLIGGSSNEKVYTMTDLGGATVIQGRFDTEVTYDGQVLVGLNNTLFQASFNNDDGELNWFKQASAALATSCVPVSDTSIISVGYYHDQISIDGHLISETDPGSNGYIISQNSSTGVVHWLNDLGGSGADALLDAAATNSGVLISGFFQSSQIGYEGSLFQNSSAGSDEPIALVLDFEGKPQCEFTGLGSPDDDSFIRVEVLNDSVYGLISFSNSTFLDPFSVSAQGSTDLALWKTCLPCDTINSITGVASKNLLGVFPNPSNSLVTISIPSSEPYHLQLIDATGRVVLQLTKRTNSTTINVAEFANGIYSMVATTQDGERYTGRLMVNH